jgi:hypothetical protein
VRPIWDQEPYRERAAAYLERLSAATTAFPERLRAPLNLKAGTYPFFNEVTRLFLRGRDLCDILERLCESRAALRALSIEARDAPVLIGQTPPRWREAVVLRRRMRLDFETLYLFGNVSLDLWAAVSSRVVGRRRPLSFGAICNALSDPETTPADLLRLATNLRADVLWLAALVRFHRNHFIVHVERPWQISESHTVDGYDFALWSPLAGSANRSQLGTRARSLATEVGVALPKPETPHQILLELLMNIDRVPDRAARMRILKLYGEHGSATPSFHVVADRLLKFLAEGTELALTIALNRPKAISLGTS